ncbi:MAG: hypothetical protein KGL39_43210 [Patescibacteria group bacterium]|nr:hypothetical protein [Patescibacteria group bacterium]
MDIPQVALSVQQPWAWAITEAGKDIENRSRFAITKGEMRPRRIAIHASLGMTREDYKYAAQFMATLGIVCPLPDKLARGAIVGAATVTAIVSEHTSPWFFGPRGLVLADQVAIDPIPAVGALGYFRWWPSSKSLEKPKPWMVTKPPIDQAARDAEPAAEHMGLFGPLVGRV